MIYYFKKPSSTSLSYFIDSIQLNFFPILDLSTKISKQKNNVFFTSDVQDIWKKKRICQYSHTPSYVVFPGSYLGLIVSISFNISCILLHLQWPKIHDQTTEFGHPGSLIKKRMCHWLCYLRRYVSVSVKNQYQLGSDSYLPVFEFEFRNCFWVCGHCR